jgi:hypothetical protein
MKYRHREAVRAAISSHAGMKSVLPQVQDVSFAGNSFHSQVLPAVQVLVAEFTMFICHGPVMWVSVTPCHQLVHLSLH